MKELIIGFAVIVLILVIGGIALKIYSPEAQQARVTSATSIAQAQIAATAAADQARIAAEAAQRQAQIAAAQQVATAWGVL